MKRREETAQTSAEQAADLLSKKPKDQVEADAWIDQFSRIDSSQIDEKQKNELMGRAQEHYEKSSFAHQIFKKGMEEVTTKLNEWQGPLREFLGIEGDSKIRSEPRRGYVGRRG